MPVLLGIDPGLASLGVAVVEKSNGELRVVALDVLRTAKSSAKRRLLQSEDTTERLRSLAVGLNAVCTAHRPAAVCMESFSPPRSASVAAKCGMAVGLVVGLSAHLGVPIFQVSPQTIRRRLGLPKGATKEQVHAGVFSRLDGASTAVWSPVPTSQREHALDALAAAVVCAPEVLG